MGVCAHSPRCPFHVRLVCVCACVCVCGYAATLLLNIKSQLEGTGYFIVHELQLREIDLQDPVRSQAEGRVAHTIYTPACKWMNVCYQFEDAILDKILTLQSQRTEANNREVGGTGWAAAAAGGPWTGPARLSCCCVQVALIQAEIEKIGADAAAFAQVVLVTDGDTHGIHAVHVHGDVRQSSQANATSFGDYLVKVREAEGQK